MGILALVVVAAALIVYKTRFGMGLRDRWYAQPYQEVETTSKDTGSSSGIPLTDVRIDEHGSLAVHTPTSARSRSPGRTRL